MYRSITGIYTGFEDSTIFVLNNGIEWEIQVSAQTLHSLPETGNEIRCFLHLQHKEDGMSLFGFLELPEKNLFKHLISVQGIGPKQALKMLSHTNPRTFMEILEQEDIQKLAMTPGIGKKTAQKILLTLKDRYVSVQEQQTSPYAELVESLVNMGFDRRRSQEALRKADTETDNALSPETREKALFKNAIIQLSSETNG